LSAPYESLSRTNIRPLHDHKTHLQGKVPLRPVHHIFGVRLCFSVQSITGSGLDSSAVTTAVPMLYYVVFTLNLLGWLWIQMALRRSAAEMGGGASGALRAQEARQCVWKVAFSLSTKSLCVVRLRLGAGSSQEAPGVHDISSCYTDSCPFVFSHSQLDFLLPYLFLKTLSQIMRAAIKSGTYVV